MIQITCQNIINWFKKKYENNDISFTFSNIKPIKNYSNFLRKKIIKSDISSLQKFELIKFSFEGFKLIIFSVSKLITGNYSNFILLSEFILLHKVRVKSAQNLAKEYFFIIAHIFIDLYELMRQKIRGLRLLYTFTLQTFKTLL